MCGNNAAFNGSPDGKNGVALALWRVKQKTVDRHAALGIVGRNGRSQTDPKTGSGCQSVTGGCRLRYRQDNHKKRTHFPFYNSERTLQPTGRRTFEKRSHVTGEINTITSEPGRDCRSRLVPHTNMKRGSTGGSQVATPIGSILREKFGYTLPVRIPF